MFATDFNQLIGNVTG